MSEMESQSFKRIVDIPQNKGDLLKKTENWLYLDLVSDRYPMYLLPPDALASIRIASIAQGPQERQYSVVRNLSSYHSTLISNNFQVQVHVGVYTRSDNTYLWRIGKCETSLQRFYQQIECLCAPNTKLPSLSKTQVDAAVAGDHYALDEYLDKLLRADLSDLAALAVCEFLSTGIRVKRPVRMRKRRPKNCFCGKCRKGV
jgi:hypothetical protein